VHADKYFLHSWIFLRKPFEIPSSLLYIDEKENQIFLIYKEIQSGAFKKSYMTNGFLIYGEIFAHFLIY
jgi:hypothetical protein